MGPAGDEVVAGECTLCGIGVGIGIGVSGDFDIESSCKQQWR